eukprot:CAMPEP_0184706980 /NCGR_PEP_ID=MMETSP0313-20130426/37037_1 /TAXON_ID=2792 /ORGANISM="Porphyridium aerugineum, Strain SAG 1380-2" /LENGTH=1034 /DNA_ID=CAMNT_0027168549 /DNA_START=453 /DNA_END=3557 /DNA_ORIENTATION=+
MRMEEEEEAMIQLMMQNGSHDNNNGEVNLAEIAVDGDKPPASSVTTTQTTMPSAVPKSNPMNAPMSNAGMQRGGAGSITVPSKSNSAPSAWFSYLSPWQLIKKIVFRASNAFVNSSSSSSSSSSKKSKINNHAESRKESQVVSRDSSASVTPRREIQDRIDSNNNIKNGMKQRNSLPHGEQSPQTPISLASTAGPSRSNSSLNREFSGVNAHSDWYELDKQFSEKPSVEQITYSPMEDAFRTEHTKSVHRWLEKSKESEALRESLEEIEFIDGGRMPFPSERARRALDQALPRSSSVVSTEQSVPAYTLSKAAAVILKKCIRFSCFWWFDLSMYIYSYWSSAMLYVLRIVFTPGPTRKTIQLRNRARELELLMRNAGSFRDWYRAAFELDEVAGNNKWKAMPPEDDSMYDTGLLRARLVEMAKLYKLGDVEGLMFSMRAGLVRNLGGICNPELHRHSFVGTKRDVEDYVNVVVFLLSQIARFNPAKKPKNGVGKNSEEDVGSMTTMETSNLPNIKHNKRLEMDNQMFMQQKLVFFNETRHAFGRTALMLSGGSTMGLLHLGVAKALLEQGLLPRVICGTSAGSMVAALIGSQTHQELFDMFASPELIPPITGKPLKFSFFDNVSLNRKLRRFLHKGILYDVRVLQGCLREILGDLTFEEAYLRTRRILNISVSPIRKGDPAMLLNYLTAPNVLIWSAAAASCALPVVFAPVELVAKNSDGAIISYHPDGLRWLDGSVLADVPLQRISELFNVNHFIVSQVNPHVATLHKHWMLSGRLAQFLLSEIHFRYWQLLHLDLVPNVLKRLFPIFAQPYTGDVTILPDVHLRDWLNLFRNPTQNMVKECIRRGEQITYPKIDEIRHHCLIEMTLQDCIDRLVRSEDKVRMKRKKMQNHAVDSETSVEAVVDSALTPSRTTKSASKSGKGSLGAATAKGLGSRRRIPSWLWGSSGATADAFLAGTSAMYNLDSSEDEESHDEGARTGTAAGAGVVANSGVIGAATSVDTTAGASSSTTTVGTSQDPRANEEEDELGGRRMC